MISICMATYNGEKFIKEQLDSILSQISQEDEIIISDDGSVDRTIEIINSYKDDRIKLYNHNSNNSFSGHEKASANFENALLHSSGDYIFLCDQDDIWMDNKVSKCIDALKNNDFVFHNAEYFNNDDSEKFIRFKKNPIPKVWIKNIFRMSLSGCCIAVTRNCLNLCLPFPKNLIGQDYWISTIAIKYCKTIYISDCLIKHRRYNESVSTNKKNTIYEKIKYRFILYKQLVHQFKNIDISKGVEK